eukprot:12931415-Prorocentrum_lima.AAC.1
MRFTCSQSPTDFHNQGVGILFGGRQGQKRGKRQRPEAEDNERSTCSDLQSLLHIDLVDPKIYN